MRLALLLVVFAASTAHADPAADVTRAFTVFVDGVAAGKPSAGVELLVTPSRDSPPVATDLSALAAVLDKPRVKITKLVVAKTGKSAWLVGDVTARLSRGGKAARSDVLRASAVLELDGGAWRVRATVWSAAVANRRLEGCGMLDFEIDVASDVPAGLAAPVKAVADAYQAMPLIEGGPVGGGDRRPLLALLSDGPDAVTLGSAPGERFAGGAAVKALFKKWNITLVTGGGDKQIPARARATADGELAWIYLGTMSHAQCTHYRTIIVLAHEAAGWRIVHQHFSVPFSS
jgi:ketosteroid isomerase-like protein